MTSGNEFAALDVACHLNVLCADTSPESLRAVLDVLVAEGYHRVVLPPLDPMKTDVARLRGTLAERGLSPITIAGQAPGADVSSADDEERKAGATMLRAALDLTVALGGDQMNGVPYGVFGHPAGITQSAARERAAAEVGRIAEEAADRGVMMTFEVLNRYETSVVNTAAQAMEFVGLSGSDNLRIHLDTFHMAVEEADLAEAITLAAPKLGFLELGQSGRGMLSTGAVDLEALVRHAFDVGWRGRFGVEAFSRSILAPAASDMLAIWRTPYRDGAVLAQDAMRVIRRGFSSSVEGRRAARLSRVET